MKFQFSTFFTGFRIIALSTGCFLITTALSSCSGGYQGELPPRPSPAEEQPFSQSTLEEIWPDLVGFKTGLFDSEFAPPDAIQQIDAYLTSASWARPEMMSRVERTVFWANLYNAISLRENLKQNRVLTRVQISGIQTFAAGREISVDDIRSRTIKSLPGANIESLIGTGSTNDPFPDECVSVLNIEQLLAKGNASS